VSGLYRGRDRGQVRRTYAGGLLKKGAVIFTLTGAVLRGPRPRVPPVVGGGCPCYGLRGYYSHGLAIARRIGRPLFLRTHSPGRR